MKLWIIETNEGDWDSYDSFVIRAETEQAARDIASDHSADEGREVWLDSKRSTCKELMSDGAAQVILDSYNAG